MMLKSKTNPFRLIIQLVIFGLILITGVRYLNKVAVAADFEAYCPFGGIQAFLSFIENNSLACSMTSAQIAMGFIMILAIILFSKLFCSYICPVGTLSEWLGKLGDRLKMRITIQGIADKILRSLKYILLFITVYFTVESSELFCKWFCPYYAVTSGFDPDVNVIMAVVALVIVVAGSVFIRLFWCKYICPLGALSNVFRFTFLTIGILLIYFILRIIGIELSILWPVALLCLLAYVFEVTTLKSKFFPLVRIRRNESTCTNCKMCTKNCPMAIEVHSVENVQHIDCHLCADCVHVCPEKDTLTVCRIGKKWLPALILVILITAGIFAGRSFELPTIEEYWAEPETRELMEEYTLTGLRSITCYGSAVAFSNHLYELEGAFGLSVYVKDHRAKILYHPEMTDTLKIRDWIFTPARILVNELPETLDSVNVFQLRIDNFLDLMDADGLAAILKEDQRILGLTTEFACPVKVTLFTQPDSELSEKYLKDLVEQRNLQKTDNQPGVSENFHFKVTDIQKGVQMKSRSEYKVAVSLNPDPQ